MYACGERTFLICDAQQLGGDRSSLLAEESAVSDGRVESGALPVTRAAGGVDFSGIMRGTLYCPECHAVNTVAACACAFCDYPIAKAALLDPTVVVRKSRELVPAAVLIVRSLDRLGALLLLGWGVTLICDGVGGLWMLETSDQIVCGNYLAALCNSVCMAPIPLFGALLLHLIGSFYGMGLPWARRVQLPVSLFLLLLFPFGTILGGATLLCWLSSSSGNYFKSEGAERVLLMP